MAEDDNSPAAPPGGGSVEGDDNATLSERVFSAARGGQHMTLYILLADQATPQRNELLSAVTKDEAGQSCPPLVIAARNGHVNCVKKILSFGDQVNVEIRGDVIFRDTLIEGVTALWAAACAGHLDVVQALTRSGADVNSTTLGQSKSPMLRVACLEGHTDVVEWMLENTEADINGANMYDNTCLMVAAYKGHLSIVRALLAKGALVDSKAKCGTTALHLSSEEGRLDVVRELVTRGGADASLRDVKGLTPAMTAANATQEEVVVYLSEEATAAAVPASYDRKAVDIEVWELLGASFAVPTRCPPNFLKAHKYLAKAMRLRWDDPQVLKPGMKPVTRDVYDNHTESTTVEDVEALRPSHPEEAHVLSPLTWEALVVRERILGVASEEMAWSVWVTGSRVQALAHQAGEAARNYYQKASALYIHALKIKSLNKARIDDYLQGIAKFFTAVLLDKQTAESDIRFEDYYYVLITAADLLRDMNLFVRGKSDLIKSKVSLERITLMHRDLIAGDPLFTPMKVFLNILTVFAKNSTGYNKKKSIFSPADRSKVMAVAEDVVNRIAPRTKGQPKCEAMSSGAGRSLLHMSADSLAGGTWGLRYPCPHTMTVLLEAGADPSTTDDNMDTPLHLIVSYKHVVSNFQSLLSTAKILIQAGAHCDVMNKQGLTAYTRCATGVAKTILKSTEKLRISLKCLSARAIKRHNVTYKSCEAPILPIDLEHFVDIHAP